VWVLPTKRGAERSPRSHRQDSPSVFFFGVASVFSSRPFQSCGHSPPFVRRGSFWEDVLFRDIGHFKPSRFVPRNLIKLDVVSLLTFYLRGPFSSFFPPAFPFNGGSSRVPISFLVRGDFFLLYNPSESPFRFPSTPLRFLPTREARVFFPVKGGFSLMGFPSSFFSRSRRVFLSAMYLGSDGRMRVEILGFSPPVVPRPSFPLITLSGIFFLSPALK